MTARAPTMSYCNCLALERRLDPAGYAGDFDDAVLIEAPLPWKSDLYYGNDLPRGVRDVLARWDERYEAGEPYRHRPLVVAPDAEYSRQGYRRVMFYSRPGGLMSQFAKVEYHVPEAEVGALVWALYEDRASLPRFGRYRTPQLDRVRDLLVCTHGTIDAACAKFGYPLYRGLREGCVDETLRVWRVSHFGGHVFAPTLMDMPTGHYWAFVGAEQAEQISKRHGEVAALRGHYRGWSGAPYGFAQAAERELWLREGWAWFGYPRLGVVVAQDEADEPSWAEVRFDFVDARGHMGTYHVYVECSHTVETPPKSGSDETYAYPQYRVVNLERKNV